MNTKSSPGLFKGKTLALFSSQGKIPFTNDKLLIWVSGILIQSLMHFITFDLKSTCCTVFEVFSNFSNFILCYWRHFKSFTHMFSHIINRVFARHRYRFGKEGPTFTKELLNFSDISSPSSIVFPLQTKDLLVLISVYLL